MQTPQHWLGSLCAALERELAGARVASVRGGPAWLSLRIDERFLCLFASTQLRLAWLDASPLPAEWFELLDGHAKSPFDRHLQGAMLQGVRLLRNQAGQDDGLELDFDRAELRVRWYPRPGAIWLTRQQELLAQQGRMDGEALLAVAAPFDLAFDLASHADACRAALGAALTAAARQRLRQELERGRKKRLRLRLKLLGELERARSESSLRAAADAMAARLHAIAAGTQHLSLDDFAGVRHELELDPRLSPAANLDALYRRAAKAERGVRQLEARLSQLAEQDAAAERIPDDLQLPELQQQARALGIELRPARSEGEKRERVRERRLPYRAYRLASGRELRVGRTAADNDAMLRSHSHARDLWLHAQGVEGSHVLLRHAAQEPTRADVEAAARVAAHFSKARNSSLVPVLVTERRYVRKPRKAKAGSVVAERGQTLFVPPGLPAELAAIEDDVAG
jgi:predicted ribosome quality control (RQC) complex YloA/Tae2 family protein